MKKQLMMAPALMMLSCLCAMAQTQTASAQVPAALAPPAAPLAQKIGVIDMQKALTSTVDGQKALAEFQKKYAPREDQLKKETQELQSKQDQFRKTQAALSDEAKASMARDIDTLTRNLQRDQDDAKQDMQQDEQQITSQLAGKVEQAVIKYAVDNKFTMVFDDSGQPNNILFASNAIEITQDVIALYNKSVAVTPPAPPAAPKPAPAAPRPAAASPAKPPATPAK